MNAAEQRAQDDPRSDPSSDGFLKHAVIDPFLDSPSSLSSADSVHEASLSEHRDDDFELEDVVSEDDLLAPAGVFPHHILPSSTWIAYTNAAVTSILGGTKASVATGLACAQGLCPEQPITADPYRALTVLGVNPDDIVQLFAVCPDERCCNILPLSELNTASAEARHLTPYGELCDFGMYVEGKAGV